MNKANTALSIIGDADIIRFESYFNKSDGCWAWNGSQLHHGYGGFALGGTSVRAHRFSYTVYVGRIPDGLTIDHLCKNTSCVNPSHLEAVTPKENVLRSTSFVAINAAKTKCLRGHDFQEGSYYVNNKGGRQCRKCTQYRGKISYANKLAKINQTKENK